MTTKIDTKCGLESKMLSGILNGGVESPQVVAKIQTLFQPPFRQGIYFYGLLVTTLCRNKNRHLPVMRQQQHRQEWCKLPRATPVSLQSWWYISAFRIQATGKKAKINHPISRSRTDVPTWFSNSVWCPRVLRDGSTSMYRDCHHSEPLFSLPH